METVRVDPRKVAPFSIVPNETSKFPGTGVYVNTVIDNPDGAEISGLFSTLLLPSIQIRGGPLYATDRTSTGAMLLSGSVPKGVDLTRMYVEEELAIQGLAADYLKVGGVGKHLDVSWAKIGTLDLTHSPYVPRLDMRRGVFGVLNFGRATPDIHSIHRKVDELDLRGTEINDIVGIQLSSPRSILMDEKTKIPDTLMEYFRRMKILGDRSRR